MASPEASRSALWRLNSELRSTNEALEREVASLRREVAARRLTRSSAAGSSLRSSVSGASSPTSQAGLGPDGTAATERLAELEAQLAQATRAAADKQAALEAAALDLQGAQAATAVADAGIAALTAQLREQQAAVAELSSQLAAAAERAATAEAERTAVESMAARTAERVLALEAQIAELLRQAEAEASQQSCGACPAAAPPVVASRPSSRGEYAPPAADSLVQGPMPSQAEGGSQPYFTRVYSALLPPPSDVEAAQERQALQQDVARLASRLAAAEAELAEQLQQKQEALGRLAAAQAEAASLRSERELLQEQAVSLQQEVSAWQQGSMLRGGPSGAEVAAEATLERSPSRTLASRQGLEAAALRRSATPASMPALAEEESEESPAADQPRRPLQQSLGRVARMASPAAEKRSAERAALGVQEAQLRAAQTEAEALRSRVAAAEAAAQAVLDLHAAGAAAACPAVELDGEEGGHQRCRQTIEGLFAQVWRERLGRQRAVAEAGDLRQKLSGQVVAAATGGNNDIMLDEAALQVLEEEAKSADHLAGTIGHCKAHQEQLQARVQQLELQLARYNTLLAAVEGPAQVTGSTAASPSNGSPSASRASSPRARRAPGNNSPLQAAVTVLQFRKVAEEADALREQLKAAQVEVASTRRRERESRARYQQLQAQLSTLSAGLGTVQSLLQRQGQCIPRRASGSTPTSPAGKAARGATAAGRRSSKGSAVQGDVSAAMAALSALLRSLQAEGTANSSAVVSPQASEGVEVSAPSSGTLPRGPTAEKRSDPLEQVEEEGQAQAQQAQQQVAEAGEEQAGDDESLDVEALLPEDAAAAAASQDKWTLLGAGGADPATPLGLPAAAGEGGTIPAQWQQQGSSAASARARSRIPLPPPASSARAKPSPLVCSSMDSKPECSSVGTGAKPSPAKGSPSHPKLKSGSHAGSASPGRGIKALFGCGSPRPGATLSSSRL
ncbi:hypothetical protein C2E21_1430 [Chlorella sorokiniana]|uniref:Uncharacterized protein n=1 Tax=Chlorella sorokiniana TaxID=3076 RepID=A0A2P6U1D4_CHLSO|nr:hypothetical protein C2E21_1430 [Chlorella sorokiniana]|eukprot:PRW60115.1 hypothetical protein C2E21_1430 [Chlorella sorokiniana]